MTNITLCSCFRKAILVSALSLAATLTCWAGDLNSLLRGTLQTATIEMPSGTFELELSGASYNESLSVNIAAYPKDRKSNQVKIADEANALKTFLASASNNGIQVSNIRYIFISRTDEQEVQERLANAAAASKAWKRHSTRGWPNWPIRDLLLATNAFKEIGDVLHQYGLRIVVIGVENVATTKRKIEGCRLELPVSVTASIGVNKEKEGDSP